MSSLRTWTTSMVFDSPILCFGFVPLSDSILLESSLLTFGTSLVLTSRRIEWKNVNVLD